jgi:type II secretory ATPase GspE/PulE/Tfp pilus assembly ATPase PilB-like protein
MVLVTGPTGSGKTVSLYTALGILNDEAQHLHGRRPGGNPPAGRQPGAAEPKRGMTFAAALRSFLRQDPDVIMVGEIRDLETAEIAIKAAQTGHMVLSTLHTNDAPQTIARLMNMGIAPYNITSSVTLVIAQRLARRLCPTASAPAELPEHACWPKASPRPRSRRLHPVRARRLRRVHRGLQGPHRHLPGHADDRRHPGDRAGRRQRHADRRGVRPEGRHPRPAPVQR